MAILVTLVTFDAIPEMTNAPKKVLNIPRVVAANWKLPHNNKLAWISINDPNEAETSNSILDECPNLKLLFEDLPDVQVEKLGHVPPTLDHAIHINNFIKANSDKNFIVNCAAGVSRSGAICKFMEDFYDYTWVEFGKENSDPNRYLYNFLKKAFDI